MADLTGQVFGRLTVVSEVRTRYWLCNCSCGGSKVIYQYNITKGATKSCGCLYRNSTNYLHKRHGKTKHPVLRALNHIKDRCYNKKCKGYKHYGERGISLYLPWHEFTTFWDEFGHLWPGKGYSIDRIDVNGNYEPGNVRWILRNEQNCNKRNNIQITHNGVTKVAHHWAIQFGIPRETFYTWVRKHGPEKAIQLAIERNQTNEIYPSITIDDFWPRSTGC